MFRGTPKFDAKANAEELSDVDMESDLSVADFQLHLLPCEKPEGHGSRVYRRQMMVIGQYKVHVNGLEDYGIPNGFYMVREEFAKKLLRNPARKSARTGMMFAAKLVTVQEFYEKNDHIEVDIPPTREPDPCPGL